MILTFIRRVRRWYFGPAGRRSFRHDRDIDLLYGNDRLLRDIGLSRYDLPFMMHGNLSRRARRNRSL